MTHQLDLMPTNFTDAAVLARIDAQLPKVRDVRSPRLREVLHVEHSDAPLTAHHEIGGSIDV